MANASSIRTGHLAQKCINGATRGSVLACGGQTQVAGVRRVHRPGVNVIVEGAGLCDRAWVTKGN